MSNRRIQMESFSMVKITIKEGQIEIAPHIVLDKISVTIQDM